MEENNSNNQNQTSQAIAQNSIPPSSIQSVEKPKPKFKFPIIIAGVILFLVLIGTASTTYMFVHKPKPKIQQQKDITQIPAPPLTPTPIPTFDTTSVATLSAGTTYMNNKDHFSMQVPIAMQHTFSHNTAGGTIGGIPTNEAVREQDIDNFSNGEIVETGFRGESLKIIVEPQTGNKIWDYGATQVGPDTTISMLNVASNNVKKVVDLPFGNVFIGPLVHNGYVYNFEVGGGNDESGYKDIYNMLSTFKFTK